MNGKNTNINPNTIPYKIDKPIIINVPCHLL